ncbi:sterol desaturase family protein [Neobacillus sp. PS3-34]|uniref:sterol desaturase family protein n=1 Tax=Neobacillus sp. PS3-34 TaxID=3070678 RepID=UPI0027E1AB82|nr:sterol desaturase family protein [Neobacillus sp. PS3-34]WML48842.1 sterol desaturase family protein [Neobacillus sp. PS3-34]
MERLYRNFFLHTDILIMFLLLLSGITTVFWFGADLLKGVYFILGMLTFALSEYFTHRFVFHLKAPKNPFFLKLLRRLHYDHHTYPNDLKLLFLPLWYSIPNFLAVSGIFYLIEQNMIDTVAFGLGLMGMLLLYEWKHYVAHRPMIPRTRFCRWIKKVHILHHYKNENYWFGVSTPFADFLFGTFREEKQVETSKTAKNLEKRA